MGYSPWVCKRVRHNWATKQQQQLLETTKRFHFNTFCSLLSFWLEDGLQESFSSLTELLFLLIQCLKTWLHFFEMSWLCFCPLLSSGPPHFLLLELVLMALRSSSSTWGNLVLDDLFLQLTRAPLLQSLSDLLTPGFTTFGEGKSCPSSHTILTMAHHTLLKIHVVAFDILLAYHCQIPISSLCFFQHRWWYHARHAAVGGFSLCPWIWGFLKILHYLCFVVKVVMFFTLLLSLSFLMWSSVKLKNLHPCYPFLESKILKIVF